MAWKVKNWQRFQHYQNKKKGARLPWIKLYRDLLDDPEWFALSADSSKTLVMLWLIACDTDGVLPELRKIAFRLRMSEQDAKRYLSSLSHWIESDSSDTLDTIYKDSRQDKIREDKSKKKIREEEEKNNDLAGTSPALSESASPPTEKTTTTAAPTEKTPLQKVITVYKIVSGYPKDDKEWDKTFFPRHTRSAKALLDFMGNWKDAADCIEDTFQKIKAWNPEATITIDGVLTKHAAEWKRAKLEKEVKRNGTLSLPSDGSVPVTR